MPSSTLGAENCGDELQAELSIANRSFWQAASGSAPAGCRRCRSSCRRPYRRRCRQSCRHPAVTKSSHEDRIHSSLVGTLKQHWEVQLTDLDCSPRQRVACKLCLPDEGHRQTVSRQTGQSGLRTSDTSKDTSPTTVPVLGSVSWHCWRPLPPTETCTTRRHTHQCDSCGQVYSDISLAATAAVHIALQASAAHAGLIGRHASCRTPKKRCRCRPEEPAQD